MKKTLLALAAAGLLASAGAATANGQDEGVLQMTPVQYHQDYRHDERYRDWYDRGAAVNDREARINDAIQRGIQSGRINEREARRLSYEMSRIEAKERDFNRDGHMSRRESDEINRDLDRIADNVRRDMRD